MSKTTPETWIDKVQAFCDAQGVRFTAPRRHVIEIIARAKKPMGAYDILAELGKKMDNPKPPTAYRALEFLEENRFIHRIESLNAYVICETDHLHQGSQFMICDSCGDVAEAHLCQIPDALAKQTKAAGFRLKSWDAELHGLCRDCHAKTGA